MQLLFENTSSLTSSIHYQFWDCAYTPTSNDETIFFFF